MKGLLRFAPPHAWAFAALTLGFALWCASVVHQVTRDRAAVEWRVLWMIELQSERKSLRAALDGPADRARVAEIAGRITAQTEARLDASTAGPAADAARTLLRRTKALATNAEPDTAARAFFDAADGLIVGIRTETGRLSRRLGESLDALYVLVAAALSLAAATLFLMVLADRRRQQAQRANDALRRELGERRLAETTLKERSEALARSNRDLEQFAYAASHDLKEPLRAIGSFSDLVQRRYATSLDDEGRRWLSHIASGAVRMTESVDGLLEFARLGNHRDEPVPVPLDAVVREARLPLERRAEDMGATIEVAPLPVVHGHRALLVRLFRNLLDNALKFSAGSPHPRVRISAEHTGAWAEICVSDNGIGLDPEDADAVFRLFGRLHSREEFEGSGIGLTLSERAVEAHGGRIWIEPGEQGADIRLTLPVSDSAGMSAALQ